MLFLVLLLAGVASSFDVPPSHRLDPAIPTVSPHIDNTTADSCIGQCALAMIDALGSQIGPDKTMSLMALNYNEFLRAFSNVTFFQKFCTIYHTFQHCAAGCESGYLHQLLMRSSEVIDHFCVYRYKDIHELFPCIGNMQPQQDCLRICTPHHQAVTTLSTHLQHFALGGNSEKAEQYLGESCEYVLCSLHCDVPDIAHRCGHDTANLVVDLTRKSFATMQKTALDTGVVHKWPKLCEDITTYRLPQPVQPPEQTENVITQSPNLMPEALVAVENSTEAMAVSSAVNGRTIASAVLLTLILL